MKQLTNEWIDQEAEKQGLSVCYVKTGSFWYDLKFRLKKLVVRGGEI